MKVRVKGAPEFRDGELFLHVCDRETGEYLGFQVKLLAGSRQVDAGLIGYALGTQSLIQVTGLLVGMERGMDVRTVPRVAVYSITP